MCHFSFDNKTLVFICTQSFCQYRELRSEQKIYNRLKFRVAITNKFCKGLKIEKKIDSGIK